MDVTKVKGSVILVVDDNPANLSVLFNYLNQMGLKALVAQSGASALEQVQYDRPDLILLDILMPDMDGFETCRRLKARPESADIPIIFMTALTDMQDIITGFDIGAVDYITKPFYQEEVLARITTHLTLQRQHRELTELNAMKDKFFSIIAHDMKEAFATLVSLSDYLVLTVQGQNNVRRAAQMVENSVHNVIKLLENLLNWAKLQSGRLEFQPTVLDLHNLALENIVRLRSEARNKQIRLSNQIAEHTCVFADQNMLNMVLRSLLSNAIWFTEKGGAVTIAAAKQDQQVQVTVSDTGVGMAPDDLAKLFRIDKKFRKIGTAGEQGTGLGLILCKDFIKKHGGDIWITSERGKGTTVTFTLPEEKTC
jgi:two-component system, sensor histidine kinase and response regulator